MRARISSARISNAWCAATAVALALLVGGNASAGSLTIDMDLSGSTLEILGGVITVPPDGSITGGSASITVPASSATNPMSGPATVSGITLAGTLNATVINQATVTGNVGGSQVAAGAGTLDPGLLFIVFGGASLALTGAINCTSTGPQCGFLGLPISLSGTFPLSGTLPVGNLGSVGNATLAGVFSFTVSGISASLQLVGAEISRTFIPEPATGTLVGGGLVVLSALARGLRSRRAGVR